MVHRNLLSSKKTQSRAEIQPQDMWQADFFTNKLKCPSIKQEYVGISRCETKAKQKPTND